jgi:hypothetical protein
MIWRPIAAVIPEFPSATHRPIGRLALLFGQTK